MTMSMSYRYLSIYHGHVLASMDEDSVVKKLYAVITTGSIGLTILEYTCLSNVKDMFAYNVLQDTLDNWTIRFEATVVVTIVAVSLMMVASQFRIERDAKANDIPDQNQGLVKKLKIWLSSNKTQPCQEGEEEPSYSVSSTVHRHLTPGS